MSSGFVAPFLMYSRWCLLLWPIGCCCCYGYSPYPSSPLSLTVPREPSIPLFPRFFDQRKPFDRFSGANLCSILLHLAICFTLSLSSLALCLSPEAAACVRPVIAVRVSRSTHSLGQDAWPFIRSAFLSNFTSFVSLD